jgi:putative redox protein
MKASVHWTGEVSFKAESETGHSVQMDGPPDQGGENRGSRPMEMLLMGECQRSDEGCNPRQQSGALF